MRKESKVFDSSNPFLTLKTSEPVLFFTETKVDDERGEKLRLYRVTRQMMAVYLCIASSDVPPIVSKRVALNVNCKNNIKLFFQIYIKKHVFFYLKKSCPTSDDYDQSNRTFRVDGYRNPSDLSNRISSAQCQSLDETRSSQ